MVDILWIDGFELDRNQASLQLSYPNTSGWGTLAATVGRFGGKSIRSISGSALSLTTAPLPWTLPSNAREAFFGTAFRASAPEDNRICAMEGGVVSLYSWQVKTKDQNDGTYKIALYDADDVELVESELISYGDWVHFEVNVLSQASGTWEFRFNGNSLGSGTSNFIPSGVPHSKATLNFPDLTGYVEFDDYYVSEIDFLGPQFTIEGIVPDGEVSTDWAPRTGPNNYTEVDEDGSDEDSSYVQTVNDGDKDVYTLQGLTVIQGAIEVVRAQWIARNTTATNSEMTPEYIVGDVSYQGSLVTIIGTSYQSLDILLPLNPAGGVWDKTDFSDIGFGMTKGTPVGQTVFPFYDEDDVWGYMTINSVDEKLPLFDEADVEGFVPTQASNTEVWVYDESDVQGFVDLEII